MIRFFFYIHFQFHTLVKPYTVTIESGNEEDRFKIIQNSTQAHTDSAAKPEPTVYHNVTLNGEVIIICPNNTNTSTQAIEKNVQSAQTFGNINTDVALVIINKPLDYEATSRYLLQLKVQDAGGRQGYVTILVGSVLLDMFL